MNFDSRMTHGVAFLLSVLAVASPVMGQLGDEEVDFDRPEAWAMRYFTAAQLMQGNGAPPELSAGQWGLGFEVAQIPRLSRAERTVGFNGTKEENLNKAPVLARPLVHYGVTERLSVTFSYVPPVEVFDRLRTHLTGASLNLELYRRGRFSVTMRGVVQWSEASGDFTCAEEIAGDPDPERNPYQCEEPSDDTFTSWSGSIEASVEYRLPVERRWTVFANGAYTYADLDFEVDAHYSGMHDQRHLSTDGHLWSFGLGTRVHFTDAWSGSLSVVHVPLDIRRPPDFETRQEPLTHFRLALNLLL